MIPTYNGLELLRRCLASIARHRPDRARYPIEIVVVDNGSTDGTSEWLSQVQPDIRRVRLDPNGGFCAAANAGIAAARGAFIQLLNNDTEVTAGWVEAALAPFADETVGSVAPLVLVRSDPSRVDSAGDSYAMVGWPTKRGHGQSAESWATRPGDEVFGASGSSAFYRAGASGSPGDSTLCSTPTTRTSTWPSDCGGPAIGASFAPDSRILHDISATNDHRSPELQRRISRNAELVFWWNLPHRMLALAIVPHLAFVAAQAAWRLARGRLRPFAAGKLDALRAWRQIRERRLDRSTSARIGRPSAALRTFDRIDRGRPQPPETAP